MVSDAMRRGEIPPDADAPAVVNMLFAMYWGMGFFAGFVHQPEEVAAIAKQLGHLFVGGLLNNSNVDRPLTIAPRWPTAVGADEYSRSWHFDALDPVLRPDAV
jgi:hypothetical protein